MYKRLNLYSSDVSDFFLRSILYLSKISFKFDGASIASITFKIFFVELNILYTSLSNEPSISKYGLLNSHSLDFFGAIIPFFVHPPRS